MKGHILTPKALGAYLVLASLYQIGIYFWPGGPPNTLDPRIGVAAVLIGLLHLSDRIVRITEWGSAAWLLFLGLLIFSGRQLLRTYIVSEFIMAAPTLVFLAIFSLGGHMVFGAAELFPFCVMLTVFSGVPLWLAIHCLREGGKQPSGRVNG